MVRFCEDVDVLRYEPGLFGQLYPASQVLSSGTGGELAGTTFEAPDADFVSGQVEPGGVIYLRSADGLLDGIYEIAAVDSATQLCVSVLRADSQADAIAPPASNEISYRISTYRPQTADISWQLTQYLGIRPGQAESKVSAEDIMDAEVLRQVCAFGVIAGAYAVLLNGPGGQQFERKAKHYERLFEKGKERCRVALDLDGDGTADSVRFGGFGRLIRE